MNRADTFYSYYIFQKADSFLYCKFWYIAVEKLKMVLINNVSWWSVKICHVRLNPLVYLTLYIQSSKSYQAPLCILFFCGQWNTTKKLLVVFSSYICDFVSLLDMNSSSLNKFLLWLHLLMSKFVRRFNAAVIKWCMKWYSS